MKASELFSESPWIVLLVYGYTGTGKTTYGALAPRPLILLAERKGKTSAYVANPDARVAQINSFAAVKAAINTLQNAERIDLDDGTRALRVEGRDGPFDVQTLVIDSLTRVCDLCRESETASEEGDTTLKEWGRVKREICAMLVSLEQLECHVVVTCLASDYDDEGSGRRTLPRVQPKSLASEVGGYFDGVGFVHKRGAEGHGLGWNLGGQYDTKRPASQRPIPNVVPFDLSGAGTLGPMVDHMFGTDSDEGAQ